MKFKLFELRRPCNPAVVPGRSSVASMLQGEGAGDDASSWVVCGHRHEKWVAGSDSRLGTKCRAGAAIGCAVGVHTAGAVVTSVSVNGSLAPAADGVAVALSAAGHASSA